MDGVLVRFRIANGHKLVEHAFCQGLVHVFRDWNGGTEASKVAKILLHFPVEQNCAVDRYLHLFFFKLAHFFLAHLLAKRWKSPACKENYQQRTNNQSRMDLAITECQTTSTIRDLADGRLGQHYPRPRRWTLCSTIRDLADGRWAALSATSQMDADTRNGTDTHEGACMAAHFVLNAQK